MKQSRSNDRMEMYFLKKSARLLTVASGLLLFACGSIPEPNYYTLHVGDQLEGNGAAHKTHPMTIGVSKLESGLLLSDDRLIYRQSEYEVKFWNYQRWVAQPNTMVTEYLVEYLKSRKHFDQVVKFPSATRVRYVLGGKLLAFEEWDKNGEWFGKVAFELFLRDLEKEQIIWRQTYQQMVPVEQKLPVGVVAAVSRAMMACFEEMSHDFGSELDSVLE